MSNYISFHGVTKIETVEKEKTNGHKTKTITISTKNNGETVITLFGVKDKEIEES
jgi:hypothetical protein